MLWSAGSTGNSTENHRASPCTGAACHIATTSSKRRETKRRDGSCASHKCCGLQVPQGTQPKTTEPAHALRLPPHNQHSVRKKKQKKEGWLLRFPQMLWSTGLAHALGLPATQPTQRQKEDKGGRVRGAVTHRVMQWVCLPNSSVQQREDGLICRLFAKLNHKKQPQQVHLVLVLSSSRGESKVYTPKGVSMWQ